MFFLKSAWGALNRKKQQKVVHNVMILCSCGFVYKNSHVHVRVYELIISACLRLQSMSFGFIYIGVCMYI